MAEYEAPANSPSSGFAPTAYEDLVEDHPEVVSGQSDRDPYNNNEAYGDQSRPLHPRR